MDKSEQKALLEAAIVRDQIAGREHDLASLAAERILQVVSAFRESADFDGNSLVPRISKDSAKRISEKSQALADALNTAKSLLDELNQERIDGREAAVPLIASGRYELSYGGAAQPRDVHTLNRARRIAANVFLLCNHRNLVMEKYAWPERAVEWARGVDSVVPEQFVPKILDDLAHDMEIAAMLHEAVANEYSADRSGPQSAAPVMLATCMLAWHDATGRLPIGQKPARDTRPDAFAILEEIHGRPLPRGFSRDTWANILAAFNDKDSMRLDTFRLQFKLQLRDRDEAHEH